MKKCMSMLVLAFALAGCNSDEKDAQALIDQARGLWDDVMPAPPEQRGGNMRFTRDTVTVCVNKLGKAKELLEKVAADYGDTNAWGAASTKTLDMRVRSQVITCNQIKHTQGW